MEDSKVWCSGVTVKKSLLCSKDQEFDGAFAAQDFKKGDLVEKGIMRRLPEDFDGQNYPFVFTWSNEQPNKTWAMGSGCSPYYNTSTPENANTEMKRFFDEDRFEIYAKKDIKEGEELTHTYLSLQWRNCFKEIDEILKN